MIGISAASEIELVAVQVAESDLADLRARLDRARFPEPEMVPDASRGIQPRRLSALLDTWRKYGWRATEARWNAIPHHPALLDGLSITFWHVRSPEPDALPLLTHGWPDSVLEFEDVLGPRRPLPRSGTARPACVRNQGRVPRGTRSPNKA